MKKTSAQTTESKEAAAPSPPKAAVRSIFLFGRLENEVTLPVIKKLMKLDREKEAPIDLYINSAGGNGYNADAVVAVMHSMRSKVNTICLGHALSGACEILASGTGIRSSYEFATLMFHQTLWEADGDITNLEIQAAQGQRFREAQVELLHRCTGQDKQTIRKDIERDHYMSAEEALRYGIIDKVLRHERSAAQSKNGGEQDELPKQGKLVEAAKKPAATRAVAKRETSTEASTRSSKNSKSRPSRGR